MNKYAWAYHHSQHWLIDVYDMFKGGGHCKREFNKWDKKELKKKQKEYHDKIYGDK